MPRTDRGAKPLVHERTQRSSRGLATAELLAPDFSLKQLSYFAAAAHHESMQRAADALHVSAPAITAAIAHLEATLGVPLFIRRHARGLVLTDAGKHLAIECRNLLANCWELGAGWAARPNEVRGGVHIGCLLTFAPFVIPPLVAEFQKRFPQAKLHWDEGHHEYLMEGLQRGAFELAILYDFEVPSGIECRPLRPAPLQAVLPGGHALAHKSRLSVRDLAGQPLVLLDLPRTRDYMLSVFSAAGVTPHIAYRAQSVGMLRGLVASGLGYSLLNFCPPYTDSALGTLVSRPITSDARVPNIVVAHSHRYQLTRVASALIDCAAGLVRGLAMSARRARK